MQQLDEAGYDLQVAEVDPDPGGASLGRICDPRYSPASGDGVASRGVGARHQERTGRPRRRHQLIPAAPGRSKRRTLCKVAFQSELRFFKILQAEKIMSSSAEGFPMRMQAQGRFAN